MRFQVTTNLYQFSHGTKPRGAGQWAFTFHVNVHRIALNSNMGTFWAPPGSRYTAAVAAAKQFCRIQFPGATDVTIRVEP